MTRQFMLMAVIAFYAVLNHGPAVVHAQSSDLFGGIDQFRHYFLGDCDELPTDGAVKVTFLGTGTVLFDDGETQLMTDGFFSRPPLVQVAAARLRTDRRAVDLALKFAKVDRLKALFVAHSHYDHVLDAAYVVQQTGATLYGSASTLNVGWGGGLREEQIVLYEPGKELTFGQFTVTILRSIHSPPFPGINDDLGQTIDLPLRQPAHAREYKEGGTFDVLIRHGEQSMLVKPSANYIEGALDDVRADVLFLGTATLAAQTEAFQNTFYDQTVGQLRPQLVIPIHWDNFFRPLSDHLVAPASVVDDVPAAFDFLIDRLSADEIQFGILQGYQSVLLFGPGWPNGQR